MAANPRDIIIRPIVTEKTSDMMKDNKYTFQVAMGANKTEIRQAIEAIFDVKVVNVNTVRVEGKKNAWADLKVSVPITRKQL